MAAPAAPQTFPYDHLFKILIIGDAGVGKVSVLPGLPNEFWSSLLLQLFNHYT